MANEFKIWSKQNRNSKELVNYTSWYQGKESDSDANHIVMFENASDLIECVEYNFKNGYWTGVPTRDETGSWAFGNDYPTKEATLKALEIGAIKDSYIQSLDKVKYDLLQKHPELIEMERHASLKKRKRKFSECGDELDIDRYMGGEIDMWQSMPRREVPQSVKMLLNVAASAGNDYTTFRDNMVLFVAMLDILNTAGISTEVWVGAISKDATHNTNQTWNLTKAKGSAEPLDISRMLTFGISGFFRYLDFAITRNISGGGNRGTSSLGRPCFNPNPEIKKLLSLDVIIGGTNYSENATIVVDKIKEIINPYSSVGNEQPAEAWNGEPF